MSAPRPEGMSDERLEEMQRRLQAAKTSFDAARSRIDEPPGLWIDLFNVLTDATEAYGQIHRHKDAFEHPNNGCLWCDVHKEP